jgi:hypothetical protein
MRKAIPSSIALATAAALVVACSGAEGPKPESSESSVGHTEEALGEAACGTNAITSSTVGAISTPSFRCA